jgi:hypothetical protein
MKKRPAKSNRPQKLFAKLVKVTKKRFDKDPLLKRPYNEVQKWVSANLYKNFKGQPPSKVKITDIKNAIEAVIGQQIVKIVCGSVFQVLDGDIEEQNWWEFFDNLKNINGNVKTRLNAGNYGVSDIKLAEDLQNDAEAEKIINEIRSASNNKSGSTIIGSRRILPGKKDDGDPCSYFIDFILSDRGVLVDDPTDEVFSSEEQSEETMAVRRERLKRLKKEKSQRAKKKKAKKRDRPQSTQQDKTESQEMATRKPSDIRALNAAMSKLEGFYNKGLINKKEFKNLLAELIKKFEEGGQI